MRIQRKDTHCLLLWQNRKNPWMTQNERKADVEITPKGRGKVTKILSFRQSGS
jgi:hypothetical protein